MDTVTPLYSCLAYQTTAINICEILYVIFKFTNGPAGFYVTR